MCVEQGRKVLKKIREMYRKLRLNGKEDIYILQITTEDGDCLDEFICGGRVVVPVPLEKFHGIEIEWYADKTQFIEKTEKFRNEIERLRYEGFKKLDEKFRKMVEECFFNPIKPKGEPMRLEIEFNNGDKTVLDEVKSYKPMEDTMNFSEAVKALEMGNKITRMSWDEGEHLTKFIGDEGEVLSKTGKGSLSDVHYPYILLLEDLKADDWFVVM